LDIKKIRDIREVYDKSIKEKEEEGKHKLEILSFKHKLDKIVKERYDPEKCERNVRKQSWFEVMCPKCKMSNRRWLEEKKDPAFAPIKKYDNPCHTRIDGVIVDFPYNCINCRLSFSGEEEW